MSVTLRQRKKGKKISLYLDIYRNGVRGYEYLEMYLFPEPDKGRITNEQKEHNKKTSAIAEKIRNERYWEYENGTNGIGNKSKLKSSFILYMETLAKKREESEGNHGNWLSGIKHLKEYDANVTFAQIDKDWLEGWKDYLISKAKTKADKSLAPNTQFSYYSKTVATLKKAFKEGIISKNPSDEVEPLKEAETEVEFLTIEELNAAAKADCDNPLLKRAFLFSGMTGLRWSDIEKLTWGEIQHSKELGYFIRFKQKKTKRFETLQISEQARNVLGQIDTIDSKVFDGLKYSSWNNVKITKWMMKAGITKGITFHCARHSFATLQITLDTPSYVVQNLLGHRSSRATQRYARVIDKKKQEAMNKIKLDLP